MAGSGATGGHVFSVDLGDFSAAIGRVGSSRDAIEAANAQMVTQFQAVEAAWQSPAGESFTTFLSALTSSTQKLQELLDDMVTRMQTTYRNYADAETSNTHNLS